MLFTFGAKDQIDGESHQDGERQDEPGGVGDVRGAGGLVREEGHGVKGVGIRTSPVAGGQPKRGVDSEFDPRSGHWFASEFGHQFREPVDDPDVQPLEARPMLVAMGGQHAIDAHRGGRFGVVSRITEIDHVFRAYV